MPTGDAAPTSVAELVADLPPDGTPVVVRAFLHATGDVVVACDDLAETYPPQPGGATIHVDRLDLDALAQTESHDTDRWTSSPVLVEGRLDAGPPPLLLVRQVEPD